MTPSELHSRILLHELRTILLDETREGPQIPYKELITKDPHNPSSYLILSEELDDQLAELCRIQVELIKEWPLQTEPSPIGLETVIKSDPTNHPFYTDHLHARLIGKLMDSKSHWAELTARRWELTQELYAHWPPSEHLPADPAKRPRNRDLGRTTRMLTDILRYCALGARSNVLAIGINRVHAELLFRTTHELCDQLEVPHGLLITRPSRERRYLGVFDSRVQFAGDEEMVANRPNITFTDHACPTFPRRTITVEQAREEYALGPDWPNPQLQFLNSPPLQPIIRGGSGQRITDPAFISAIRDFDNLMENKPSLTDALKQTQPDNQKETHLP